MKKLFQRTKLWEVLRDKWVFDVMTTGKSMIPAWLLFEEEK